MARTALTLQTAVRGGLNPTFSAANADGNAFDNATQRVCLYVKNGSGGSIDVTIVTPITIDGKAVPDNVVAVPASQNAVIGPFPHAVYCQNDAVLGITHAVHVNYSGVTSLTVAAIKIPAAAY